MSKKFSPIAFTKNGKLRHLQRHELAILPFAHPPLAISTKLIQGKQQWENYAFKKNFLSQPSKNSKFIVLTNIWSLHIFKTTTMAIYGTLLNTYYFETRVKNRIFHTCLSLWFLQNIFGFHHNSSLIAKANFYLDHNIAFTSHLFPFF